MKDWEGGESCRPEETKDSNKVRWEQDFIVLGGETGNTCRRKLEAVLPGSQSAFLLSALASIAVVALNYTAYFLTQLIFV